MPEQKRHAKQDGREPANLPLSFFACPNSDCADFNRFDADNLSVAEWMGKDKAIRRLWGYKALPSQKWQRQTQASSSQTTFGFADRSCKKDSRQPRQFVESIDQSIVWQKERNCKTNSRVGYWPEDQHLSYGTTPWHYKRPAGSSGKAYPQRLSSSGDTAVFDMAVVDVYKRNKTLPIS